MVGHCASYDMVANVGLNSPQDPDFLHPGVDLSLLVWLDTASMHPFPQHFVGCAWK